MYTCTHTQTALFKFQLEPFQNFEVGAFFCCSTLLFHTHTTTCTQPHTACSGHRCDPDRSGTVGEGRETLHQQKDGEGSPETNAVNSVICWGMSFVHTSSFSLCVSLSINPTLSPAPLTFNSSPPSPLQLYRSVFLCVFQTILSCLCLYPPPPPTNSHTPPVLSLPLICTFQFKPLSLSLSLSHLYLSIQTILSLSLSLSFVPFNSNHSLSESLSHTFQFKPFSVSVSLTFQFKPFSVSLSPPPPPPFLLAFQTILSPLSCSSLFSPSLISCL